MKKTVALFNSCSYSELQGANEKIGSGLGFTPSLSLPHKTCFFHDFWSSRGKTKQSTFFTAFRTLLPFQ